MPKNQDALLHGYKAPAKTREPRRREEIWRLTKDGATISCELLDDSTADAGWEVVLRRDGELIIGHRSGSRAEAQHAATVFAQDYQRTGWTAIA